MTSQDLEHTQDAPPLPDPVAGRAIRSQGLAAPEAMVRAGLAREPGCHGGM